MGIVITCVLHAVILGLSGHAPLKNQFSEGALGTKIHCCDSMPAILPYTDRTSHMLIFKLKSIARHV